jgi:hypothetical protein
MAASSSHKKWFDNNRGWLFLALVTIAFYIHNLLSPEFLDDYVYKFVFDKSGPDYSQRISNLWDVFRSQYGFYFAWNGRTGVQFLGQLFCGLLGKPLFNVLNALVFAAFIYLLRRQVAEKGKYTLFSYALVVALVLLLPTFCETFLWVVGSVNYLWCSTGVLLFLWFYEKNHKLPVNKRLIPLWPCVFLLGWTHEGIVLPLAAALVAINVLTIKKSLRTRGFWLALILLAGTCMAAFAPSLITRSGASSGMYKALILRKLLPFCTVLSQLRLVYLAILLTLVLCIRHRDIVLRTIKRNIHLIIAVLLSFGIVFASGMPITRPAFGLEFFSLVYLLRLVGEAMPELNAKLLNGLGILLTVGIVVFYGLMMRHAVPNWQETERLVNQIEQNTDSIISTQEHNAGPFTSFMCTMIEKDTSDYATNFDPRTEPASIAATYHRKSLVFLPKTLLDDLKTNPQHYDTLNLKSPYGFYIKRIGKEEHISQVNYLLRPLEDPNQASFFRRLAIKASHYPDTISETHQWVVLDLYDNKYLVINKINAIKDRLTGFRIVND